MLTQKQVEEFLTIRSARRWPPQFLAWAADRGAAPQDLLFPNRLAGRPFDPQYLTRRLRTLGTSISALQNTAR